MPTERKTIDFGDTDTVTLTNSLSKADKNAIARNFPVTLTVDLPLIGEQEFAIRDNVKSLLDNLPSPSFEIDFTVEGDCETLEDTLIEATAENMVGTYQGSFQVVNVGVAFSISARVVSKKFKVKNCKCSNGTTGKMGERHFQVKWYVDIDVNPGIGGTYPMDTHDVYISTPCCCEKSAPKRKKSPAKRPAARKTKG